MCDRVRSGKKLLLSEKHPVSTSSRFTSPIYMYIYISVVYFTSMNVMHNVTQYASKRYISKVQKLKIFNWTVDGTHYPFERPIKQKSIADNALSERAVQTLAGLELPGVEGLNPPPPSAAPLGVWHACFDAALICEFLLSTVGCWQGTASRCFRCCSETSWCVDCVYLLR